MKICNIDDTTDDTTDDTADDIIDDTADDTIDDTWIYEFNKLEKSYDEYYKNSPSSVDAIIFFMNQNNEIERIKKEQLSVKNSIIDKSLIINIITQNKNLNKEIYKLHSILKYNFTLDPTEVNSIFNTQNNHTEYLSLLNGITDIVIHNTIYNFHDLNAVFIFMKKITYKQNSYTKKNKILIKKTRKRLKRNPA